MAERTLAQNQALKAAILADPTASAHVAQLDYSWVADWLNEDAAGPVKAWRLSVPQVEIDEASNWTAFDTMSAGKRDSWRMFFNYERNFTRNKVRGWVKDVWGTVTTNSDSEKLLQVGMENASRAENVIGGTVRTEGTASALDRAWVGDVSVYEIGGILAS